MKNIGLNSLLAITVALYLFGVSPLQAESCSNNRRFRVRPQAIALLDSSTNKVVPGYRRLQSGFVLDLAFFPNKNFKFKARFRKKQRCRVRSVDFFLRSSEQLAQVKNRPFVFSKAASDRNGLWVNTPGNYSLEVQPRSRRNGKGRKGRTLNLQFTVSNSSNQTPIMPPVDEGTTVCSAGGNIVLPSPHTSTVLQGICSSSDIQSISWRQLSGPSTIAFSDASSLRPQVSGMKEGRYILELRVQHADGEAVDTVQVAISKKQSPYDFTFSIAGPKRVVAGFPLFLDFFAEQSKGSRDFMYIAASGLPWGMTLDVPVWYESCCSTEAGEQYGWDLRDTVVRLDSRASTPAGTYPVLFSVVSGGVVKQYYHTIIVEPRPAALGQSAVATIPAIPALAQWEDNMQRFGRQWCEDGSQGTLWEGNVWYYDGTKVFYQIADYFDDSYWSSQCLGQTLPLYRDFVETANPGVQGWRVFPHGLFRHYQETGKTWVPEVLRKLADDSVWSFAGGGVDPVLMRETAYLIHAYLFRLKVGLGIHPRLERSVAFALGHLEQLAQSKTADIVKPFMLGLTFEALIHYYEESGDPRVPTAIKQAADWLWYEANVWDEATSSFLYVNKQVPGDDPPLPAPDLNLLIAPAYAWLYHKTGEAQYQQIADAIFEGGVSKDVDADGFYDHGACLACTGKIFSQNYRWSFDFVRWRQNPPQ